MRLLTAILLLAATAAGAQPALTHFGGMQLHQGAEVGMHTNLLNEAPFDQNLGRVGFYGFLPLRVGGSFAPRFFDVEIANDAGVDLDQMLEVENNLNFIGGDFRTNRFLTEQYVSLLQNAFTVGESNLSKVDGFVRAVEQTEIVFPVGDATQLRPLTYQPTGTVPVTRCAYFREDPTNSPYVGFLDPDLRPRAIEDISRAEYWRLEGSVGGTVTVSWNAQSNLGAIATDVNQIVLVGWNKPGGRWIALGTASVAGDLTAGFAISEVFNPDEFVLITFGSLGVAEEVFDLPNYYLSPNGDGINDSLVIEELADSPNNQLRIYDRRGLLVYEADNYGGEFNGVSNTNNLVFDREAGLPEGIYFYVVRLLDLGAEYQGFLYLRR